MKPGFLEPTTITAAPRPLMPMRSRRGLPKSSRLAMSNSEGSMRARMPRTSFLLLSIAAAVAAASPAFAEEAESPSTASRGKASSAAAERDGGVSWGAYGPAIFPQPERLVAIGDLHGDLPAVRRVLRLAGVLHPERDEWAGGKTVCVQVGDQLDRGDDELPILALLAKLSREADKAGGALHVLLGNHETMTVMDQMNYGTKGAFDVFDAWEKGCSANDPEAKFCDLYRGDLQCMEGDERCQANLGTRVPDWARARYLALRRGGVISRDIFAKERRSFLIVGDTLFVHGGLLPETVRAGSAAGGLRGGPALERMNRDVAAYVAGEGQMPAWMDGNASPYWTRFYSQRDKAGIEADGKTCGTMMETFSMLPQNVSRMVVGHTPQPQGINEVCAGGVWRIDIGLSSGVLGGEPQVLEILPGGNVNVLREGDEPIRWKPQVVSRSKRGGGLWSLVSRVFGRGGAGQGADGEGDATTKQQCTKGGEGVA